MRGHTDIIANRLQGRAPKIVFVNDYPCKTDWLAHHEQATVCTAADAPSSLDLRFLVGLRVSIAALTQARAQMLFERAKASGAALVVACHVQPDRPTFGQTGWSDIFSKEPVCG